MTDYVRIRAEHFAREHLVWITVRHFLSADMLKELACAIVGFIAQGRISLDELFSSVRTGGPSELSSWFAQPHAVDDPLQRRLQQVVQSLAWTGDQAPGTARSETANQESIWLSEIDSAFRVATLDFNALTASPLLRELPDGLQDLADLIASVNAMVDDGAVPEKILSAAIARFQSPLDALVIKHLGDLSADADRWRLASAIYGYLFGRLEEDGDPAWSELIRFLRDATEQSRAASKWALEGADAAHEAYIVLTARGNMAADPAPLSNATIDALNAGLASTKQVFPYDARILAAHAPQLIDTHDLESALSDWRRGEYDSSHRRFWAALRRQTALGSVSATRTTKAFYGHSIIDSLRTTLRRERSITAFQLGARLLIESGDVKAAERIEWSEEIVEAYVNSELIKNLIEASRRVPGVAKDREAVAFALLKRWAVSLPTHATALAQDIVTMLAEAATKEENATTKDARVTEAAIEGIFEIARSRPEFIASTTGAIAEAIAIQIMRARIMLAGDALNVALEVVELFDRQQLTRLAEAALSRMETFEASSSPWPFVRPAIALLSSEPVLRLCADNSSMQKRLPRTIVRFALESGSEHASLLYLLRDLDPAWLHGQVDASRLDAVVAELRNSAQKINSSGAPDDIMALLVAPAFSGAEGVRDALRGLKSIIQSAANGRPAISFGQAYRPMMLATEMLHPAAYGAPIADQEFRDALDDLATQLVRVWEQAGENPLIFAGFAIPQPTTPNVVLVHNWTFASVGLARALGREKDMDQGLAVASRQQSLEGAIAVSRATRFAAGDVATFDIDAVLQEKREPYYAALGRRLLLLAEASVSREDVIRALVHQCLRLGPNGLDAGVFSFAVEHKTDLAVTELDLKLYRQRLEQNPELRISLGPLLGRIGTRSFSAAK